MYRSLLLIALVFSTFICYSQTTVIAVKTKKAIYVGADGRINFYAGDPRTREIIRIQDTMCKIWTNGKVGFAILGLNILRAKAIAISICNNYGTLDQIIPKYIDSFGRSFVDFFEEIRTKDPNGFLQLKNDNSPNLSQAYFFGILGDSLSLMPVQFKSNTSVFEKFELFYTYGSAPKIVGGKIEEIREQVNNLDTWRKDRKIPKKLEELILVEANAHPTWVGLPIDIIKITRKGKIKWIKKQSTCKF